MDPSSQRNSLLKKWWFWVGAVLLLLILIGRFGKNTQTTTASIPAPPTAPSPPPSPTEPATNSGPGIGKTRSFFVATLPDVNFSQGKDIDGEPNYVGTEGAAMFQLIGPEDNLTEASVTISMDLSDQGMAAKCGRLFGAFANTVAPGSSTWFANNIERASKEEVTKHFGKILGKISVADMGNNLAIVSLTFSAS